MTAEEIKERHRKIEVGIKKGVAKALERHRLLGEPIAVWRDGRVIILPASEITATRA